MDLLTGTIWLTARVRSIAPDTKSAPPSCWASQFADPVGLPGDPVLDWVPSPLAKDLVLAKAAWNALCPPWVPVVHQMEVQVRSGRVTGMAGIGKRLACGDFVTWSDLDRVGLRVGN